MKNILLFCFLFLIKGIYAQEFYFEPFANTITSNQPSPISFVKLVKTINDSTIIVAGEFSGTLTINDESITALNSRDIFIANLTEEGEPRWLMKIGSDLVGTSAHFFNDEINDLQIDNNGAIIACGYVGPNAQFDGQNQNVERGSFIAKISVDGDVEWHKVMENYFEVNSGDNHYRASTITITPQNEYILGGIMIDSMQLESTIYYVDESMNSNLSNVGVYYMSLNDSGIVQWFKSGKGGAHFAAVLNQTPIKLIYHDGSLYGYGLYSTTLMTFDTVTLQECCFTQNLFVTKFDLQGNLIWAKSSRHTTGEPTSVGSRDMIIYNNQIIISGEYSNPIGFDDVVIEAPGGLFDFFIGSFDLDGNTLSLKNYGGENTERLNHFSVIENKLFGFGHYDTSTDINEINFTSSITPSEGSFLFNPFYVELDDELIPVSGRDIKLEEEEYIFQNRYNRFTSVASNSGNVFMGGIYKGDLTIDDVNYSSTGFIGSFIIKAPLLGTHTSNTLEAFKQFELFPNPARNQVSIKQNNLIDPAFISLHNLNGDVIFSTKLESTKQTISLNDFVPGVYIIQMLNVEGQLISVEKLVVF